MKYRVQKPCKEMIDWLVVNVGEYDRRVLGWQRGNGWRLAHFSMEGGMQWLVEIEDEKLATAFLLRWG